MQGIPGSGVGPGGAKAPAYDSDPAPGGASAPAKDSGPTPGGAKAPAKDSDPAPGGALTPAEDSDPAPGGAKAPAAPDISLRFLKMCFLFFKCSPHLPRRKNLDFYFPSQPKESRYRQNNKKSPARLDPWDPFASGL